MGEFIAWLEDQGYGPFADYHALHQWSIDDLETFWAKVWEYCGLVSHQPAERVLGKRDMPGAEWFPGMKLNFAANLLRLADGESCQPRSRSGLLRDPAGAAPHLRQTESRGQRAGSLPDVEGQQVWRSSGRRGHQWLRGQGWYGGGHQPGRHLELGLA